ncbi:hypothetical protein HDV00_000300 [Rhizophlyctis rosea]|nr:hypothetical protein HDV00_000300 [Rhizophlyctis rosea]
MPIFFGLGDEFIKEMDDAVEKIWLDFVSKWMKATKFDVLGFTRFYGSLLSHIKNEAWCDGQNGPIPTPLYPSLVAWQRAAQPGGGSFRLAKRHRAHNTTSDSEDLIRYREEKILDFIEAWRVFLRSAAACLKDLTTTRAEIEREDDEDDLETEYPWAEALFRKIRKARTIDELPPIYLECFKNILNVLAHTIDNTLRRTAIEQAVKDSYRAVGKPPVSSQDTLLKIKDMLWDAKISNADDVEALYAKLLIRKIEKEDFVDALGSDEVTRLVVHICKSLPPILSEIWECTDFAKLFSKFFDTIPAVLAALKPYDQYRFPEELPPSSVRKEMVRNVASSLRPFFDLFYTFLQTLADKEPKGPAGLHAMIDWVISESVATDEKEGSRKSIMDFAKGVPFVENVSDGVWKDVEVVIDLMEKGVDERTWPAMEHLEGDILKIAMGAAVKEFVGLGGASSEKRLPPSKQPISTSNSEIIDDVE